MKYPPRICFSIDIENKEEAKAGAMVRIVQPVICTRPLIDPIIDFGAD